MTPLEIQERAAKYRRKINKLRRELRFVQDKQRELQSECNHPNQYPVSDYAGGRGHLCPDCNRDTS